jgi:sulfonate transport system substrate-binding protein
MTRLISLLVALALLAGGVAACGSGDDGGTAAAVGKAKDPTGATVRIGVLRGSSPINLVQEDGSLQHKLGSLGTKVEWAGPFPAFAPAAEALNANAIDITIGSITSAVGAFAGQSNFTIFARQVDDGSGEGIVVKPGSGIASVADLKGKKVAVNRGGTGEYLLLKALDQAGLSPDDVQRVYLPPADAAPAFGSDKVDAWATWSAFTVLARAKYKAKLIVGGRRLRSQNDIVFVVRTKFLQEYPTIVKAVFDALHARTAAAAADPEGTARIASKLQGVPVALARSIVATGDQPVVPIDAATIDRFQGVADYFSEKKVVPNDVTIKGRTVDVRSLAGGGS